MNTYTWKFPALEAYPQVADQTNVVFTVHWRLEATDGTHTTDVYGSVGVQPYTEGAPFVPFEDLTPEIVQEWVEEAIGADSIASLKSTLDSQLAVLAQPQSVVLTPPWLA